ncbi:single-stranded-DNA-specific exonuclease RecJ [Conexibacter sp. CPCC 206217]|uniref:single-stranded-DNA-specific exonuclease RecJ n=1 Tax=Conexibacter sp. CPCC 206217 TaxID=3064574 RepID=UPI0027280B47|nr:single-stranded-DNA-specific exonuclease RecJ [Conexibacter sp. CPCC 206217]MDO8210731.1 single-stranded-DNA-specific exonuclease RecJ [Conexibacter sp. CPCC 206217]
MSATIPPPADLAASVGAAAATVSVAAPPRPQRRIALAPCDPAAVERLRRELRCSRTLAQVLVRRGHDDPPAARAFLAADETHAPSAFAGIDVAVETILRHVRAGTRITVHGDYDVDGVASTAILLRALRQLGADADWFLPSRIDDGYGLAATTVERLAARGTRLLITVDCAITAVEEVAAARAQGLDVVVTDHHQPRADGRLPDAPIVHPSLSGYPCPDLCAGGVAYKLAQALHSAAGGDPARADEDLDLVALATVADLVPLRGENRRLVREGLRALASTGKVGLRALMRVARVDPSGLDASAVGFRLAPRINAAGRLYRADAGVELLLTEDEDRARLIAEELDTANGERRMTEQRILWEAEEQLRELGERPAYVLAGEGWHPGVIGIVASRVVERTNRPALLIALDADTGTGTGSGRSIPRFDLLGALHAAAPLLERYGGHRAAAGVTIDAGNLDALRAAFEAHAAAHLTAEDVIPVERVDAVVDGKALGLALADELQQLQPCGMGNPNPNLLVPAAEFDDLRTMGQEGKHARFTVAAGGVRCRAVAFGCDGRLAVDERTPADATFRLERNEWNGAVEPRLLLRHAVASSPASIELLGMAPSDPGAFLTAVLADVDRSRGRGVLADMTPPATATRPGPAAAAPHDERPAPSPRDYGPLADRRGDGGVALLHELVAGGARVLALCADTPRREVALSGRVGGFALCSHTALELDPSLADGFDHVVALDPPASRRQDARMRAGGAEDTKTWTHLTWGDAELRFAQQIHESEYGIRAALVPLYRALRDRGGVAGEELGRLLRGDGHGRSVQAAARLVAILEELELVSLDRELQALTVLETERTALERSATYRTAIARYEDGQRFLLETATTQTDAPPA